MGTGNPEASDVTKEREEAADQVANSGGGPLDAGGAVDPGTDAAIPGSEANAGIDNPESPNYDPEREQVAPEGETPEETQERREDEAGS